MTPLLLPMLTLALLSSAPSFPGSGPTTGPTCRSIDGQVACGYACKSDGLRARCAQTPQGRCQVIDGQAACFDPPAHVAQVYGASLPEPECKTIDGVVACGYSCVTDFGKVKCARTPAGVCRTHEGDITCFDPPAAVYALYGKEAPRAECRSYGTQLACGYKCLSSGEGVKCATTPLGVCKSENGRITCFDPPASALCSWGKSIPAPQCRSNDGTPVCGYSCTAAFSRSACAATPAGVCKVFDSSVYCFDPPASPESSTQCLSIIGLATLDAARL
ncbi:hypothetical protein P2318_05405 [Myxococcaceae bacterium GXIMD 01537]